MATVSFVLVQENITAIKWQTKKAQSELCATVNKKAATYHSERLRRADSGSGKHFGML